MATGLLNQYNASYNITLFLNRITISICAAAQSISSESSGTVDHANRVALAKAVANNPSSYTQQFALMLGAQAIDNNNTDAEINSMVSSVWNCIAGVP